MLFLLKTILFHDAGNIFSRKNHQRNISTIYDYAHAEGNRDTQEKRLILQAVEAHCGKTALYSADTLKELGDTPESISEEPIRLRNIAAVVRFADELAEGPVRTSLFMKKCHNYTKSSKRYHQYAECTNIHIDRGNNRIVLTYNIKIKISCNRITKEEENNIRNLIEYIYKRVSKLNQERKYVSHYCEWLQNFKKINITFAFNINEVPHEIKLPEINDLIIPGDKYDKLEKQNIEYNINSILKKIKRKIRGLR